MRLFRLVGGWWVVKALNYVGSVLRQSGRGHRLQGLDGRHLGRAQGELVGVKDDAGLPSASIRRVGRVQGGAVRGRGTSTGRLSGVGLLLTVFILFILLSM